MELYFLIIVGFLLRVVYYIFDNNKPFSFKTPEGIANIKMLVFPAMIIILAVYLCSFAKFDDNLDTDLKFYMIALMYVTLGWAIDNIFLNIVTLYEQHIKGFIQKIFNSNSENKNPKL